MRQLRTRCLAPVPPLVQAEEQGEVRQRDQLEDWRGTQVPPRHQWVPWPSRVIR